MGRGHRVLGVLKVRGWEEAESENRDMSPSPPHTGAQVWAQSCFTAAASFEADCFSLLWSMLWSWGSHGPCGSLTPVSKCRVVSKYCLEKATLSRSLRPKAGCIWARSPAGWVA